MSEPFLGQIMPFPFAFAPVNWVECAGQILPIGQYSALYALLGTSYGGNGTSNFAVPNMQGRVGVGQGKSPLSPTTYFMGEEGGMSAVALNVTEVLPHTHTMNALLVNGVANTPTGNLLASPFQSSGGGKSGPATTDEGLIYSSSPPNTTLTTASIEPSGGNTPHNNMQPYLALRYCIATAGTYPLRP